MKELSFDSFEKIGINEDDNYSCFQSQDIIELRRSEDLLHKELEESVRDTTMSDSIYHILSDTQRRFVDEMGYTDEEDLLWIKDEDFTDIDLNNVLLAQKLNKKLKKLGFENSEKVRDILFDMGEEVESDLSIIDYFPEKKNLTDAEIYSLYTIGHDDLGSKEAAFGVFDNNKLFYISRDIDIQTHPEEDTDQTFEELRTNRLKFEAHVSKAKRTIERLKEKNPSLIIDYKTEFNPESGLSRAYLYVEKSIDSSDNMLDEISNSISNYESRKYTITKDLEALEDQLEQMFPNADYGELEKIVSQLGDFERTSKVSDSTKSGIVMDFILDGKKYYLKATTDGSISREASHLDNLSSIHYLRAISPKKKGILKSESLEALITHDIRDNFFLFPDEVKLYSSKLQETVIKIGKYIGEDPMKLLKNTSVVDMFNRALEHTYMQKFSNDTIYNNKASPMHNAIEQRVLDSSMSVSELKSLTDHIPNYLAMNQELIELHNSGKVVSNYDLRDENFIYLTQNLRVCVDYGTVRVGNEAFDFLFEQGYSPKLIEIYAMFRNSLEQELERDFELTQRDIITMKDNVVKINYSSAVKLGAFMASKNRVDEFNRYVNLARYYENLLKKSK